MPKISGRFRRAKESLLLEKEGRVCVYGSRETRFPKAVFVAEAQPVSQCARVRRKSARLRRKCVHVRRKCAHVRRKCARLRRKSARVRRKSARVRREVLLFFLSFFFPLPVNSARCACHGTYLAAVCARWAVRSARRPPSVLLPVFISAAVGLFSRLPILLDRLWVASNCVNNR